MTFRTASLVLVFFFAASPSAAQGVPAGVADVVRNRIAELWQIDAARVVLEFGSVAEDWAPAGEPQVTLAGSGTGGHWVARVASSEGVPTGIRVRAGVETPVLVAARDLSRGHTLGADDMAWTQEVRWGPPAGEEAVAMEGWRTQRLLRTGEPLREPAVQPPLVVQSGQPVDLLWRRGSVGVRVSGKAAGSAPLGEEVYVRTDTGRRLKGVVVAPGVVDVTNGGTEG